MILEKLYICIILNRNNVLFKILLMVYDYLFVFVYFRVVFFYVYF